MGLLTHILFSWLPILIWISCEGVAKCLHVHALGDRDAVHLEDVRLADAELDEAVLAVRAHVGPLPRVPHAVFPHVLQCSKFQLAQITWNLLFLMGP